MEKVIDESPYHDNKLENSKTKYKVKIFDEVLSYGYTSNEKKIRKGPLIDTSADGIFLPKSKYQELLGKQHGRRDRDARDKKAGSRAVQNIYFFQRNDEALPGKLSGKVVFGYFGRIASIWKQRTVYN